MQRLWKCLPSKKGQLSALKVFFIPIRHNNRVLYWTLEGYDTPKFQRVFCVGLVSESWDGCDRLGGRGNFLLSACCNTLSLVLRKERKFTLIMGYKVFLQIALDCGKPSRRRVACEGCSRSRGSISDDKWDDWGNFLCLTCKTVLRVLRR